jgi:hypothetical protein
MSDTLGELNKSVSREIKEGRQETEDGRILIQRSQFIVYLPDPSL